MNKDTLVSVIVPIHNGSSWIDSCFTAICEQETLNRIRIEVCVCNDASTDNTSHLLENWNNRFQNCNIALKVYNNITGTAKGVGFAKNRAVDISSGTYLCFQDIDDVMLPYRVIRQFEKASELLENTIVGSQFRREPSNSTMRYTRWANGLNAEQLQVQIYTSYGPTVIMPTWFCHRTVFNQVGGFSESGKGTPEDLIFFYKHLDLGGKICRVDQHLLVYTYHPSATTFSILESTIWDLRLEKLEALVLSKWSRFTIWNAGKQGRRFFNSLCEENQAKVTAFCDVDVKKIGKQYRPFDSIERKFGNPIDIVHFKKAAPPMVVCVKIDLTNGEFENNLKMLKLKENVDYVLFS